MRWVSEKFLYKNLGALGPEPIKKNPARGRVPVLGTVMSINTRVNTYAHATVPGSLEL